MEKRRLFSIVVLLVALASSAQVQYGYVKTKGTKNSSGSRLNGVVVRVRNGNTVTSSGNGEFSFNVPGKNFSFSSVRKAGYTVVDEASFLRRNFVYSNAWQVIVMEKPEQHVKEVKIVKEQVNKTLEKNVKRLETEIAKLEKEGKRNEAEIRQLKQKLSNEIKKNKNLLEEMAEYYVSIDYDQMDDISRHAKDLILNGELNEANKLLDKQVNEGVKESDVREKQDVAQKSKDSYADWCYNKYSIFLLSNQEDSAAFYIEKRAKIDEKNLDWQLDAATFYHHYGREVNANAYYEKAVHFARWQASDNAPEHLAQLAIILNNLALLYQNSGKANVEQMHQEAAAIFKKLVDSNDLVYEPYLASVYNNLGIYYSSIEGGHEQSEKYYNLALETYNKCLEDQGDIILKAKAGSTMNNLGDLYNEMGRFEDSEKMYKDALSMFRQLNETLPNHYDSELASSLNGLSSLYQRNDKKDLEVESMTTEALSLLRELVKNNRYLSPNLVSVLYNKANFCVKKDRNSEALSLYDEAIKLCRPLKEQNVAAYGNLLFKLLTEKAMIEYRRTNYNDSESLFREALDVCNSLDVIDKRKFKANKAMVLRHLAVLLDKREKWQESEQMYLAELDINTQLAQEDPQRYSGDVARTYGNMSSHALLMKEFEKAEEYAIAGLEIAPGKLFIYSNLAVAKLFLGKFDEAKEIVEYYKTELSSTLLDDLNQYSTLGIIPPERKEDTEKVLRILNE